VRAKRRIVQIVAATEGEDGEFGWSATAVLFALADDGTTWRKDHGMKGWRQVEPDGLPDAEPCGAVDPDYEGVCTCNLIEGHAGLHHHGDREWR
jgi:hypothetical protein